MRIRSNRGLAPLMAVSLTVLSVLGAQAQTTTPETLNTTATAVTDELTTGLPAPGAIRFNLETGTQLLYNTKGSISMSGAGQQQAEDMDVQTSITVLELTGEIATVYAALSATSETTGGKTHTPGPRFTFQMPLIGSVDQEEFEKAGLAGSAFPTFSVETLFTAPPAEGSSSVTVALPITNAVAEGEAVTTRNGDSIQTVATILQDTTPVLKRTTMFSEQQSLNQSLESSLTLEMAAQGMPISFSIQDRTELVENKKLTPEEVNALKADVQAAIPVAAKIRTASMSSPDVLKSLLAETKAYLEAYPQGEFAFLFDSLTERLGSVVERTENWDNLKPGAPAPDFTAETIDNKSLTLSEMKGKVVLLDFWATWCGPCIMELPNIKKLYADYKDKGLEIVGISADETIEDLKQLVQQEDLQWPQVFDGGDDGGKVQEIFGVMKYPTTILIDREGNISAIDLRGEEMDEAVRKLVETQE